MKGIILAGGSGTRLYPGTKGVSKQLLMIYDKPMIYYPLSTLMQAYIRDILIITTEKDQPDFIELLGDGSQFGINIEYAIQKAPNGLAEAFIIGEDFIKDSTCAMALGDNIYFGDKFDQILKNAWIQAEEGNASIFGFHVNDPSRFGIMEINDYGRVLSVEEKPENPKSEYAITGLYFYPEGVAEYAKKVKPSKRNELEITTLNDMYLKENRLNGILLGSGFTWFYTGTNDSMFEATSLIRSVQKNQDIVISSPEAIAFNQGWITDSELEEAATLMQKNDYGKYLQKILNSSKNKNKSLILKN
jgi:glucose-1-phosphate thymidylyltransferase